MSQQDFEKLKGFLEDRPVSVKAAKPLKNGTLLKLVIIDDKQSYHIIREQKATFLRVGEPPKNPDLTFMISSAAITRLDAFQSDSIGEFGVEFFKIMVSDDPEMELEVKLHTGFLGLTRLGFFKILLIGGPSVMAFLARKGLGSLGKIRKAVAKLKSK